jgi:flagellar hook-length control protein FliK
MQTPLGEPGWEAELEARVRWLIERGNSQAELRLNPPHLGSLLVNISEDSDGTKIVFVTQNPQARELLENTLMKLQEMLQDGGVRLADTGVSDQPYTQQQGAERQDPLSLDQPYESVLDQPQDREGYVGPASRGTSAIDLYA